MNKTNMMTRGVNGSDVYTEMCGATDKTEKRNEPLLTLFGAINRGMNLHSLSDMIHAAYNAQSDMELLTILAFHVRDIEEGKGEREVFYFMFYHITKKLMSKDGRQGVLELIKIIPKYGSWLDLVALFDKTLELAHVNDKTEREHAVYINNAIIAIFAEQLKDDFKLCKAGKMTQLSLAGKWAPREGKKHDVFAKRLAAHIYSEVWSKNRPGALAAYRKMIVALNAALKTTETYMCHNGATGSRAHHFADIDPSRVASRCLKIKRRAFFNEPLKNHTEGALRYPNDADRNACREYFTAHVQKALAPKVDGEPEAVVHGKRLMPHEFVMEFNKLLCSKTTTKNDIDTLQAQWNDMRNDVLKAGTLGKTVVMSDFSSSMGNIDSSTVCPMHISFGLGLLCAECTAPAFRNYLLTFNTTPRWHDLTKWGENALFQKFRSFMTAEWGGSTNFEAAYMLILDRLIKCNIPVGDEPDIMLVITDMGWDSAIGHSNTFETHVDKIKNAFKNAGGWKVPTIIIWNVSGNFKEFHHESTCVGACTISGWSPAILKTIMTCPSLLDALEDFTPFKLFLSTLNAPRYDAVRSAFNLGI